MNRGSTLVWSLALVVATAGLALIPAVIIAQGNETMAVTNANGGACESVRTVSDTDYEYMYEADPYKQVANMVLSVPDATANGNDLLLITYSAKAAILDGNDYDQMRVTVTVDGVPIPTSGDLVFAGPYSWMSNSHQFAVKVLPGPHTVQVFWDLVKFYSGSTPLGEMDEKVLTVQRHN